MADPKDKSKALGIPVFTLEQSRVDISIKDVPPKVDSPKDAKKFKPLEPVLPADPPPVPVPTIFEPGIEPSMVQAAQPQASQSSKGQDKKPTGTEIDTLKKYVSLKEAETRDLKDQVRQYAIHSKKQTQQIDSFRSKLHTALEQASQAKEQAERLKVELSKLKQEHARELDSVRASFEDRIVQKHQIDADAAALKLNQEQWKEKVHDNLKQIKLKEKELENKYELLKRDTQVLLDSKDQHVLDLKKKSDALELELESLGDRLRLANQVLASIDSKKRRLIETMKLATSLLENIDRADKQESMLSTDTKND